MWNSTNTINVYTEDKLEYKYYPVTSNNLTFRVKARKDAHIILTTTPYDSVPCYEIFFGGWENTRSVIRRNLQKPDVCDVASPNILNETQYKGFWIRWENGSILAGVEGDSYPILRYQDTQLFSVQFFGVCTGWGSTGHWIIDQTSAVNSSSLYQPQPPYAPGSIPAPVYQQPYPTQSYPQQSYPTQSYPQQPYPTQPYPQQLYPQQAASTLYPSMGYVPPIRSPRWVSASHGSVPSNAVVGGKDLDGETIYVARAFHEGATVPGKLKPSHKMAWVPWGGRENSKQCYEVLCDCSPRWLPATGGQVPAGAIAGGKSENGETLFIGKACHGGAITPGKVQPSHGVCYIPFGGEEIPKRIYDVLVL